MSKIINDILKFRNERDWEKYHKVKDLLIGLNIEVAELQEIFLWKDEGYTHNVEEISNELSDIFIFLVYISDHFKIDLNKSIADKIVIHKQHYPIKQSKGRNEKYTTIIQNKSKDEDHR